MTNDGIKKAVKKWAAKVGPHEAMKRLVNVDISAAISTKLIAGTYESELGFDRAQSILRELAKDGFAVDDKAS